MLTKIRIMQRRDFTQLSFLASMGVLVPLNACDSKKKGSSPSKTNDSSFMELSFDLLSTWSAAMLATQINEPENPELHGALFCKACNRIHGRCMDAVYPFLYMANATGETKYLDAALKLMQWSENVSKSDGSWTVIPNPKSWPGITVFGGIALAEALLHHGHILPKKVKHQWTVRLRKAAAFVHKNFNIDYSHTNYPMTAVYGLQLWGEMFEIPEYRIHARDLANKFSSRLTQPNRIIFGENKPTNQTSDKGLYPVDLGYNVEETLNGIVQYAIAVDDKDLLEIVEESMKGHLEFMLPDGAWDNSWGTRQNKWSYWGSRTTDGCQPAFSLMADRNSAFGTAAFLSTELLIRCTVNGLLAGGLHYENHKVLPCLHHTFTHSKSLAFVLDNKDKLPEINKQTPIPRSMPYGIKHFSDLAVWLVSQGPWRATISANDVVFKKPLSQTATGGSLAVLWHEKIGPIFTASMAEYMLVEPYNQQLQPDGEDIALTPRIEGYKEGEWYTNLYDRKAIVTVNQNNEVSELFVETTLTNKNQNRIADLKFSISYTFDERTIKISVQKIGNPLEVENLSLVMPLISPNHERQKETGNRQLNIIKENGSLILSTNVPLEVMKTKKSRIFNMVPGMEALPIKIDFERGNDRVECVIEVV